MRRDFKVTKDGNNRLRYTINGAEVTPALFAAWLYDEAEAMPSNANISLSAAQLASLAATSSEFAGHDSAKTYTAYARFSRLITAVKNSEAISTKAV